MQNERTIFEKAVKDEKFPAGPAIPRPGPILLSEAITAVALEAMSFPSMEISAVETKKIAKYTKKYKAVLDTISRFMIFYASGMKNLAQFDPACLQ